MEEQSTIIVGMADFKISAAPTTITTNLGSCIGLCLYSLRKKVGGLVHIMLSDSKKCSADTEIKAAKFADTGIPLLISELRANHDVVTSELEAKIFGGAKMLKRTTEDIGADNETAVRSILKESSIKVVRSKTGGDKGYQIDFNLSTGRVTCRQFGEETMEF